jgi:hypothetical protein
MVDLKRIWALNETWFKDECNIFLTLPLHTLLCKNKNYSSDNIRTIRFKIQIKVVKLTGAKAFNRKRCIRLPIRVYTAEEHLPNTP